MCSLFFIWSLNEYVARLVTPKALMSPVEGVNPFSRVPHW